MLSRRVLTQLLSFASGIALARLLSPAEFGVFAIAVFVSGIARLLVELGASPALVQRPAELTTRDLQTAFTMQQVVAVSVVALLWLGCAGLPRVYSGVSSDVVTLVYVLSLQLVIVPWGEISDTLLERELSFERVAPIEVATSVTYNGLALVLAITGFGVQSLALAMLAATVVRCTLAYRAAPWPVRLMLDRTTMREIVRRGVPIQLGRFVLQAQYWVTPTLVAGMIGPAATGLLQWALGNGRKPIEVLESVVRVSLPHFSLLQGDPRELERTLARYVTAFALICGLWLVVLALAGADLVRLIYGERWVPAAPSMTLFAASGLLVSGAVLVREALVGVGRMAFAARTTLYGATASLVASVVLVVAIGFYGVPIGQLIGAALALPWLTAGLGAGAFARVFGPTRAIVLPMAAALAVGMAVRAAPLAPGLRGLVTAGTMTLAYVGVAWWHGPEWLRRAARGEPIATDGLDGRV